MINCRFVWGWEEIEKWESSVLVDEFLVMELGEGFVGKNSRFFGFVTFLRTNYFLGWCLRSQGCVFW